MDGDGTTIHKMPLMNILALNGTTVPMTVLIHECTKHMEEGGKKDAPYMRVCVWLPVTDELL